MTTRDPKLAGLSAEERKAVEALQEPLKGLSDSERVDLIDRILESYTVEEILANPENVAFQAYENPTLDVGRSVDAVPAPPALVEEAKVDKEIREQKWTAEELAEMVAYGETLTQDQQKQYDEYTEDPQSETAQAVADLQAIILAGTTVSSWTDGVLMRSLEPDDVLAIGRMMMEWDPKLNLMAKDELLPNESDDDTLRRNTTSILNTQNEFAQDIVNQWGADNEARIVDVQIDGNKYADVRSWADRFGTTVGRAGLAYKAAVDAGVDPELYGRLWQKDRTADKYNPGGRGTRQGRAGNVNPDEIASRGDRRLANDLKEGIAKYGKSIAAVLSVTQPDLAEKLVNDPWSLTIEELESVQDAVGSYQEGDSRTFKAQMDWLEDRAAGGFGGSASTVDTASVKEHARALANDWNLPGLPDPVLTGIGAGWYGEAKSRIQSSLPNPFARELADTTNTLEEGSLDYDTFVKNHIRKLPEYQALFGNMMPGENEDDWVDRFEGQSQGLLGDVDLEAVRAGMRSGSRDTVGQQAILSGTASTNSTFRERLAKMGEAFKDVT